MVPFLGAMNVPIVCHVLDVSYEFFVREFTFTKCNLSQKINCQLIEYPVNISCYELYLIKCDSYKISLSFASNNGLKDSTESYQSKCYQNSYYPENKKEQAEFIMPTWQQSDQVWDLLDPSIYANRVALETNLGFKDDILSEFHSNTTKANFAPSPSPPVKRSESGKSRSEQWRSTTAQEQQSKDAA